jgi:hypothetical protein
MIEDVKQFADDVKSHFDAKADKMKRHADAKADEVKRLFDANADEMKRHADAKADEVKRHFDATAEALRGDIRAIARLVIVLADRLDRTASDIREEMRSGFAETQAMIKFSHADLDRRLTSLEARVERLETIVEGGR